jgi:hypothetical protein
MELALWLSGARGRFRVGLLLVVCGCFGATGSARAQTKRARLELTELSKQGHQELLVSLINVSDEELQAPSRFLLNGAAASPGELWAEVRDDKGAELPFVCQIRAGHLDPHQLSPLSPRNSVGRLVSLEDCYKLRPGQTYRITMHFKITFRDPQRVPEKTKRALVDDLVAGPIELPAGPTTP